MENRFKRTKCSVFGLVKTLSFQLIMNNFFLGFLLFSCSHIIFLEGKHFRGTFADPGQLLQTLGILLDFQTIYSSFE